LCKLLIRGRMWKYNENMIGKRRLLNFNRKIN